MSSNRGSKSSGLRPLLARASVILLFVLAGLLLADLGTLFSRQYMLPSSPPPARPKQPVRTASGGGYESVRSRNIFNSTGKDPDPLIATRKDSKDKELPPIPSQLPLTLMGTLVHSSPEKSLAAIEVKGGKAGILSYRPGQEIENYATLEKVERMKIFIRNRSTGRLEYIEMKNSVKMPLKTAAKPGAPGEVKKVSDTEFQIDRKDLLKYTSDLSSVLMQARVVPARRGGNGEIYGYRLVEMQPGSIYAQLGLQVMDVITGVNGTAVTSPQQAMELYSTLKNSNKVKIQVERGGRSQDLQYNISN